MTTDKQNMECISQQWNGQPGFGGGDWSRNNMDPNGKIVFESGMELTQPQVAGALDLLCGSFPNFRFEVIEALKKVGDSKYSMVVSAVGKNDGPAFTLPKPDGTMLPPVGGNTGKECRVDPERFTFTMSDDGKLTELQIDPVEGSHGPFGPPAFYIGLGGKMPN